MTYTIVTQENIKKIQQGLFNIDPNMWINDRIQQAYKPRIYIQGLSEQLESKTLYEQSPGKNKSKVYFGSLRLVDGDIHLYYSTKKNSVPKWIYYGDSLKNFLKLNNINL